MPKRLSLQVLSAFSGILGCTPAKLITTLAQNSGVSKTAAGDLPGPPTAAKLRPPPDADPARRMNPAYTNAEQYER